MSANKNEATRIRLTPKERAALQAAADRWGSTLSDALRWAIRTTYIDPPKNEGHAVAIDRAGAPFGVQS